MEKDNAVRRPRARKKGDYETGDKELGVRIWRAMKRKGFTQEQLADAAGISRNVITRVVTGRRMTSFTNVERIATVLGVSLDEFRPACNRPVKKER